MPGQKQLINEQNNDFEYETKWWIAWDFFLLERNRRQFNFIICYDPQHKTQGDNPKLVSKSEKNVSDCCIILEQEHLD